MPSYICIFDSLQKYISFTVPLTSLSILDQNANNIQTSIHFQISVINSIVGNLYLVDIVDAMLNF